LSLFKVTTKTICIIELLVPEYSLISAFEIAVLF